MMLPGCTTTCGLRWLLNKPPGVIRYFGALGNDAASLLEQARELGLEGLIGKRKDSIYEVGLRTGDWIKLKLLKEQEFVIGGYTEPEGTRQFFGSIIVGFYRGKKPIFAGKVGTGAPLTAGANGQGITASEMRLCHWVEPQMVCQVKFAKWTRDERLRQPVFLGLREDKDAKELVRESFMSMATNPRDGKSLETRPAP